MHAQISLSLALMATVSHFRLAILAKRFPLSLEMLTSTKKRNQILKNHHAKGLTETCFRHTKEKRKEKRTSELDVLQNLNTSNFSTFGFARPIHHHCIHIYGNMPSWIGLQAREEIYFGLASVVASLTTPKDAF